MCESYKTYTLNGSTFSLSVIPDFSHPFRIISGFCYYKKYKKNPTISYLFIPVLIFSMPFALFPYFTQLSIRRQSYLLALEKCRRDKLTGYSPQFPNISAKSNDFFSGQTCVYFGILLLILF